MTSFNHLREAILPSIIMANPKTHREARLANSLANDLK